MQMPTVFIPALDASQDLVDNISIAVLSQDYRELLNTESDLWSI